MDEQSLAGVLAFAGLAGGAYLVAWVCFWIGDVRRARRQREADRMMAELIRREE